MLPNGNARIIELFHVAFLDVLSRRLDPTRYVLKGGANLRFFFESFRYSEDLDLDMVGVRPWDLERKIDGVLESGALAALLRSGGLTVAELSKPKQTDTTRRWKVALEIQGGPDPVRTKIETSGRNGDTRYRLERLPDRIVAPYALRAPSVQHYIADAPAEQKAKALAGRSETQARDVFDLDLLLRHKPLPAGVVDPQDLSDAAERTLLLPYSAFRDQVVAFLDRDVVELYDDEGAWKQIQEAVAQKLEEAR